MINPNHLERPLGIGRGSVIGAIEVTPSGNVTLHIGTRLNDDSWVGTDEIVLDQQEVTSLVVALGATIAEYLNCS